MALQELTLELSLKPFLRRNAPPLREVCRELFSAWLPATQDARQISVLLWSGDGTEILEYSGDLQQQFDWGRYVGIMNRPLPAGTEQNDPLHRNAMIGHPFEPETEKTDYRFLAELVRELKAVGGELTGRPVRVGTAFDPGPEFTISAFKYRKHPEICRGSYGSHSRELVSCYSTLLADSGHYTGFPEGIPAGTPFGTFFGRQATCFLRDMGMEFLWLSNGFGFGNFPWSYTGVVFDGEQFHPEELETVRKQMLELFWKEFRKECSVPVFVRGTNLTTGRDLSCDGVPLKEIYDSDAIQAPPVNSPWAPLNYDFGSELIGWMSHAAGFPADDFTFRFYVCDPWFQTRPWLANYEGEPYDIYMPWAVSRLRKNGRIVTPNRINLVTVDDCRGQMPPETAEQIIPHLRQAQRNAPDAPGPFLWLYPFAEYHRWISQESGRIGEVFAGDHFLRDAVNNGLPLNTVMDTAECDQLPPGRVIVSPVPEEHTPWETRLLEYLESGGRILLYGPLEHSPRLRELLQIRLTAPLEGELELEGTDLPETFAPDRTIFHAPPYSAGGIRETGGKTFAAREWLARNDGGYIRVQTGDTLNRLRRQVSYRLFNHDHAGNREIIEYLARRPGYVLIVDEAALLLHDGAWATRSKNINFFRDLFDGVNDNGGSCGVCFIFTDCSLSMFEGGSKAAFFGQFLGRLDNHLNIPERISIPYELKPVLLAYGLNPEDFRLMRAAEAIANGPGKMRTLYKYLALAKEFNVKKGEKIDAQMLLEIQRSYTSGIYKDE